MVSIENQKNQIKLLKTALICLYSCIQIYICEKDPILATINQLNKSLTLYNEPYS